MVKRRLFNLFTSISLLLFLATAVLWAQNYWVDDFMEWDRSRVYYFGATHGGTILEIRSGATIKNPIHFIWVTSAPEPLSKYSSESSSTEHEVFFGVGGVFINSAPHNGRISGGKSFTLILFDIFPLALFAIMPIQWFRTHRRERARSRVGLCPSCGYDLRATPIRCPECGTVPSHTSNHTH